MFVCLFVDMLSQLIPQGISPSSGFSKCPRSNLCQFGNEILKKCIAKPHIKLKFIVTRVIIFWHLWFHSNSYYFPTALRKVQIKRPKRVQISRGNCTPEDRREIRPHGQNNLTCWIINPLLDVYLCSIADNFYSLFVFWLALRVRQNTAQLVKILSDTTQQNV